MKNESNAEKENVGPKLETKGQAPDFEIIDVQGCMNSWSAMN